MQALLQHSMSSWSQVRCSGRNHARKSLPWNFLAWSCLCEAKKLRLGVRQPGPSTGSDLDGITSALRLCSLRYTTRHFSSHIQRCPTLRDAGLSHPQCVLTMSSTCQVELQKVKTISLVRRAKLTW